MLQSIDITIRIDISNTGNKTAQEFVNELDYEFRSTTEGVDIIEAELIFSEILELKG